jgi:hypothetical protein
VESYNAPSNACFHYLQGSGGSNTCGLSTQHVQLQCKAQSTIYKQRLVTDTNKGLLQIIAGANVAMLLYVPLLQYIVFAPTNENAISEAKISCVSRKNSTTCNQSGGDNIP